MPPTADADAFVAIVAGNFPEGVAVMPDVRRAVNAAAVLGIGDALGLVAQLGDGSDPLKAIATLNSIVEWCKAQAPPSTPATTGRRRKQPSASAFQCYRLSLAVGRKQAELAEILSREQRHPIGQPQVSRWIGEVRLWLESGNVLPDLTGDATAQRPAVDCVDPSKLDYVGRRPRTRRIADGD